MAREWRFNPTRRGRCVQSFKDFSSSDFATDALNSLDKTVLGEHIILRLGYERRIGFSVEPMGSNYGQYIPRKKNLKPSDDSDFRDLDGLITIDKKEVDKAILPYIIAHEGFHCVQDREEFSGLVPMYTNGVYYNPNIYRLKDEADFRRGFKTMERSADVVALCALWEMKKRGAKVPIFSEFIQNKTLGDIMTMIDDAGEWAAEQSGYKTEDVVDTCLFWGNMAAMWSVPYNDHLDNAAKRAYKTTSQNVHYKTLQPLPIAGAIEFKHYCLISESFGRRRWDLERDFEGIEIHAQKRKEKAVKRKLLAVHTAAEIAGARQSNGCAFKPC